MVEIRELDIDPNTLQGSHIPGMRILAPVIVILLLIQVHKVEGALTISKDVYGPLGGSTTLQCKNTTTVSGVVSWFKTGNPINVVGSKYSQVTIPGGLGYNLTISDLQPSDAGNYHCEIGIDAASAVYLPIQYRPGNSDINSDDTGDVITIKSYPNPTFTVVANNGSGPQTLNGTESTHDNADNTKTTTWRKVTSLSPGVYTFNVTVSAPGSTTKQFNITIYASTSTSLPTTSDRCVLERILVFIILLIICIIILIIILIILIILIIVIFVNRVIIHNKDRLQEPRPAHKDETITATVRGFFISNVKWIRQIGLEQNTLTSNGEHTIVPYDSNTRKTSLTIKNSSMADNVSYICQVEVKYGFSAHDFITIPQGATNPIPLPGDQCQHKLRLGLGLGLGIPYIACIICIVIVLIIGDPCPLKLGLGLGLGLGIAFVICIICIVVLVKKVTINDKDTLQRSIPEGNDLTIKASVCGLWISSVEWIGPQGNPLTAQYNRKTGETSITIKEISITDRGCYICRAKDGCGLSAKDSITIPANDTKKNKTGISSAVSRKDVELQIAKKGVRNNEERPPAIHTRTQNKVESETTIKQTNTSDKHRPLPPVGGEVEDNLKLRPQPPRPGNTDVKDQNHIDHTKGLATETPRSSKLPPLTPKQPTDEEEAASEKPKKKTKKKKKKKVQLNEGNPEEEMSELKRKRKSPEDQVVYDEED